MSHEWIQWVFSGIGVVVLGWMGRGIMRLIAKRYIPAVGASKNVNLPPIVMQVEEVGQNSYRHQLGEKISFLRSEVFKVNKRIMANFLGLANVTTLECYESGKEEMPRALIEKFIAELNVSPRFLDGDSGFIFERFNLHSNDLQKYINNGYQVTILSQENPDSFEHIYFALCKPSEYIPAMIIADSPASFQSTGGGWANIQCVISVMLNGQLDPYISCNSLSANEWNLLNKSSFYDKNIANYGRLNNLKIQDQFVIRYNESA